MIFFLFLVGAINGCCWIRWSALTRNSHGNRSSQDEILVEYNLPFLIGCMNGWQNLILLYINFYFHKFSFWSTTRNSYLPQMLFTACAQGSYKNCTSALLQEIRGVWPDLLITVLCDEWKKCKRGMLQDLYNLKCWALVSNVSLMRLTNETCSNWGVISTERPQVHTFASSEILFWR